MNYAGLKYQSDTKLLSWMKLTKYHCLSDSGKTDKGD